MYIATSKKSDSIKQYILEGYSIINDIKDIWELILTDEYNDVTLDDSFVSENFTIEGLHRFIRESERYNPKLKIRTQREYPLKAKTSMLEGLQYVQNINTLLTVLNHHENLDVIRELAANKVEDRIKALDQYSVRADLVNQIEVLMEERDAALDEVNRLAIDNYRLKDLIDNIKLRNSLDERGIATKNSELMLHTRHNYEKVLYFKEYTHVQYFDTLFANFIKLIQLSKGLAVRVLVIEPYSAIKKLEAYSYCTRAYHLDMEALAMGNIAMAGYNKKIMDAVLSNTAKNPLLVILDRSGGDNIYLKAPDVEYMFIASDAQDLKELEPLRVISYSPKTLRIPYIEGYNELNRAQQISMYSNMEIIQSLLNLVKKG